MRRPPTFSFRKLENLTSFDLTYSCQILYVTSKLRRAQPVKDMSCPDCFSGTIHHGEPKGKVTKAYGLDTYVTEPTGRPARGVIVIIPDAFGWEFTNSRILADHYAAKGGFKVYLPDFMNGMSLNWQFQHSRRLGSATSC